MKRIVFFSVCCIALWTLSVLAQSRYRSTPTNPSAKDPSRIYGYIALQDSLSKQRYLPLYYNQLQNKYYPTIDYIRVVFHSTRGTEHSVNLRWSDTSETHVAYCLRLYDPDTKTFKPYGETIQRATEQKIEENLLLRYDIALQQSATFGHPVAVANPTQDGINMQLSIQYNDTLWRFKRIEIGPLKIRGDGTRDIPISLSQQHLTDIANDRSSP